MDGLPDWNEDRETYQGAYDPEFLLVSSPSIVNLSRRDVH